MITTREQVSDDAADLVAGRLVLFEDEGDGGVGVDGAMGRHGGGFRGGVGGAAAVDTAGVVASSC